MLYLITISNTILISMKNNYIVLALIGFIVILAVLTNPNQDRHKEVLKSKLNTILQQSLSDEFSDTTNVWNETIQGFGTVFGNLIIDGIISTTLSTDNYLVFSTTKITYEGDAKIIGIGAFGNVFITSKLDEAVKEGLLKE